MTANTVNNFPLRPMKTPFAGTALTSANTSTVGGVNVSTLPATGDNVANVATGFPETFSTSITKGGKYLKRADINALGYIATIMAFRQQMGMPNEWNKQICDAIGGYPKGAVLDYCIWNGSVISETYKITSIVDNNTEDPTSTAQANWTKWKRVSVNAEYANSLFAFPNLEKAKSISYDDLKGKGVSQNCFLTVSAWLQVGVNGRGNCSISKDSKNWFVVDVGVGTVFWDYVSGYCSPNFQGLVAKGTKVKFSHQPNDFQAYEFPLTQK